LTRRDHLGELIPFYVNGTLSEDDGRRVEEHLAVCADCRSLLEEARALEELGRAAADDLVEHVQAQHLERFARDPSALDPGLAAWIGAHLEGCPACRGALEILEGLAGDPDLGADPRPSGKTVPFPVGSAQDSATLWGVLRRTVLHPAAAAVYLAALIAAFPLYRALAPAPEAEERAAAAVDRLGVTSLPGAVDLPVLSSAFRGDEATVSLPLAEGQSVLALGVEFELPEDLDDATAIRFAIRRAGANLVWQDEVRAAFVERNLAEAGLVVLLIPAGELGAGPYRLTVTSLDDAEGRALLDSPFELLPPGR
jgi:anti-sigma factor RsiW